MYYSQSWPRKHCNSVPEEVKTSNRGGHVVKFSAHSQAKMKKQTKGFGREAIPAAASPPLLHQKARCDVLLAVLAAEALQFDAGGGHKLQQVGKFTALSHKRK
jgi:hypothetical protein